MEEKPKRKNDDARPSLIRIIILVLLFLGLLVWIAPITILGSMIILLILQIYHPLILLIAASILGLLVAIPICIGILYILTVAFSKRSKRKRGE
jgi:hypothetical protein